jgi:hypothetical protein
VPVQALGPQIMILFSLSSMPSFFLERGMP